MHAFGQLFMSPWGHTTVHAPHYKYEQVSSLNERLITHRGDLFLHVTLCKLAGHSVLLKLNRKSEFLSFHRNL